MLARGVPSPGGVPGVGVVGMVVVGGGVPLPNVRLMVFISFRVVCLLLLFYMIHH